MQCVERDEGQYDDARDVFWASGAAFCCRAEVFRALGGFDEDFFAHMEEIDLCWWPANGVRSARTAKGSAAENIYRGSVVLCATFSAGGPSAA